ncbi:sensor histidine kinase [Rhizobium sp. CNPSo 3464]|uniref:sensor histidine kinase n=1 Tax=Rhizobium sp. CNPSo 3464 TaxID=3021406 RepID=UPI00254A19DB|nr:sensor histidine kinase [Rhizobium sp. CNPSo 3464]MDK4741201.1 sensor histidine kinase [Rhizobium sp. CNPSo 3464]
MQTSLKSMLSPVRLLASWNSQSLAKQFLLIGGFVSACALLLVGAFVTNLIEEAVTRNSAASTALYVDSVIAPLLPDMQTTEVLDDTVTHALDETLGEGALGSRLMSFRLWRNDGTILYSNDKNLMGKQFPLSNDLKTAFAGTMVAQFNQLDDVESVAERNSGKPLLEIYNPVLQPWSGKVVAVSEFYEVAYDFERSLNQARFRSWVAVALFTLTFFLILSVIVLRGSRTIESQRSALKARIGELSTLLQQNEILHARVQRASQRAASLNESYLRRIGADLHDGPAQLVAYASLRLDSEALINPRTPARERERSLAAIKSSLDDAMADIRSICSGLVLPHIESANLPELLQRAVRSHEQRTGIAVGLSISGRTQELSTSTKICIYRFVQEALNNGYRHGKGAAQQVKQTIDGGQITIAVSDEGPGFDPAYIPPSSIGLAGLRERVESLGGTFELKSSESGTVVQMSLNAMEMEQI